MSSRLMLALILVRPGSMAVLEIELFMSSMNSNSAFLIVSSVIFFVSGQFSQNMVDVDVVRLFDIRVKITPVHYW